MMNDKPISIIKGILAISTNNINVSDIDDVYVVDKKTTNKGNKKKKKLNAKYKKKVSDFIRKVS